MLKTVSSIVNAIGALNYKGTWNASTNTPTLVSGVGTKGDYYVVSVAGSTDLDGQTLWGVGDWAAFNGSVWQKVDGGSTSTVTDLTVTTLTGYMYANNTSPVTASTTVPVANVSGAVPNTVNVLAGTGLSGGGALTANVTLDLANTGVTAATYGDAGNVAQVQVNAQGQITSASNVAISISNSAVTGLGTMSTQNANAVSITGGNVTVTNVSAANVTVTTNLFANLTTNANATFATSSLPLVPEGYLIITINGTQKKIPYYGV